ncbi:ankyrin repeat domain-containing protein [Thiotrichales bacterium 19S3-7]|nr:ankyrin repeat domain-containing protein [Thiotrichales bacterium 19S3-7]MCF6802865.1 ankyrin repeat domain-containing protein [Thiotrichales bacterium 19S3-11]
MSYENIINNIKDISKHCDYGNYSALLEPNKGICFGLAHLWGQAYLLNDLDTFNRRLDLLSREYSDRGLSEEIMQAQRKMKTDGYSSLNDHEQDLLEIRAFLDTLILYHAPQNSSLSDVLKYQSHEASRYVAPQMTDGIVPVDENGLSKPLTTIYQNALYGNQKELATHLNKLLLEMSKVGEASFMILNVGTHTISIIPDGKKHFMLHDINWKTGERFVGRETNSNLSAVLLARFAAVDKIDKTKKSIFGDKSYMGVECSIYTRPELKDHPRVQAMSERVQDYFNEYYSKQIVKNYAANYSYLYHVITNGHIDILDDLIAKGKIVDINQKGPNGESLLSLAIEKDHWEIVQLLLRQPEIDPVDMDKNGLTALHRAYKANSIHSFKVLSQDPRVDVNYVHPQSGYTLLHFMAEKGKSEFVDGLLERGDVDVDLYSSSGGNALYIACIHKKYDVIDSLARHGIYELKSSGYGFITETLLHRAIREGDQRLMDIALEYATPEILNLQNDKGVTALEVACSKQNIEAVKALLAKGVDPNVKSRYGCPLACALRNNNDEILNLLIDYPQTDLNMSFGFANETLLHRAISEGKQELVNKVLVENASRVNFAQEKCFGMTLLGVAAEVDNLEIMDRLFELGVEINHRSEVVAGVTSLMHACIAKQDEAIIWLLDHGAITSYKTTDKEPKTALDFYREAGGDNPEILERLAVKLESANVSVVSSEPDALVFSASLNYTASNQKNTKQAAS